MNHDLKSSCLRFANNSNKLELEVPWLGQFLCLDLLMDFLHRQLHLEEQLQGCGGSSQQLVKVRLPGSGSAWQVMIYPLAAIAVLVAIGGLVYELSGKGRFDPQAAKDGRVF